MTVHVYWEKTPPWKLVWLCSFSILLHVKTLHNVHILLPCMQTALPSPPPLTASFDAELQERKLKLSDLAAVSICTALCLLWSVSIYGLAEKRDSIDSVVWAVVAPWPFSVNDSASIYFWFFFKEDYTDKGQVEIQGKYKLNLSIMLLWTHLNSTS